VFTLQSKFSLYPFPSLFVKRDLGEFWKNVMRGFNPAPFVRSQEFPGISFDLIWYLSYNKPTVDEVPDKNKEIVCELVFLIINDKPGNGLCYNLLFY